MDKTGHAFPRFLQFGENKKRNRLQKKDAFRIFGWPPSPKKHLPSLIKSLRPTGQTRGVFEKKGLLFLTMCPYFWAAVEIDFYLLRHVRDE